MPWGLYSIVLPEVHHPLYSTHLKMIRAYESLKTLQQVTQGFLEGNPYAVHRQFDPDSREHFITASVDQRAPVEDWSVHIGEAVHNMRSSLDHLAWQLTISASGDPPDPLPKDWRRIEFPIFSTQAGWDGKVGWKRKIWGVSPQNRARIERLQPFCCGEATATRHPLWVLHELDNVDKHRSLNIVGAAMSVSHLEFVGLGSGHVELRHQSTGPFQDGAEMARFLIPPEFHTQVEVNDRYRFDVAFDKGPPAYGGRVIATLTAIYAMVGCTLRAFLDEWPHRVPPTSFAFENR